MPRKNLTDRFVANVKVEARTDFQDELVRGLWLRVSPAGARTWQVIYSRESDGLKQRLKVGRYPAMTLEKARAAALKMLTAVTEGDDPAAKKRASRDAVTVQELGDLFIKKYARRSKRTWAEDERLLRVEVYPVIGRHKAASVKRRDILDIIEAKADAGYIAQSTQILAVIRKMFNWAVDNDYLDVSPATGIKPRGKAVRRDRVLTDHEVAEVWKALPDAALSDPTRDIFKLLFLTGQRVGEVAGMRRGEIDVNMATWTIPAARTKNGLTHTVPLSSPALEIVEAALARTDDDADAALFSRVGEPIESNAISKAARLKLQVSDTPWTPHDIRRTVATRMADIGVAPHIIEAVLNHISGARSGVAGVYNRSRYEPEKRQAVNIWAEHLDAIVTGRNAKVVPMRAGT